MSVTCSASITIPRARESVFELSTKNETYERALLPYGPVAGVAESKLLEGRALQRGALREARLTDGSVLIEEILEHDVPTRHRYKWTGGLKPLARSFGSARVPSAPHSPYGLFCPGFWVPIPHRYTWPPR